METILSYLENMFRNMADTPDVQRAKEELALMMEDKYTQLLAEGKKENEAVGIVISEFGNLDELAEELGLSGIGNPMPEAKKVSRADAEKFLETSNRTIKWNALGVLLCILCPIPLVFLAGVSEKYLLSDATFVIGGLIPLFILIGIAVAIFIYNGMKMERFEYLKKENIQIDSGYERLLREKLEEDRPAATLKLTIGIMLCIFSVIPLLVLGALVEDDMILVTCLCFLLICVGIGVMIIMIGTNIRESIKVLLQEQDYSKEGKKKNKVIDIIAGIYWPIATAIYLLWSFVTWQWHITWVVWPVAGVLFGAVAAAVAAVTGEKQNNI